MTANNPAQIVGVDGCKAGWIAVALPPNDLGRAEAAAFESFAELVAAFAPDSLIAVDMPIGLPERAIRGGRAPDWAAREFLGPRRGVGLSGPVKTGGLCVCTRLRTGLRGGAGDVGPA